MGEGDWLTTTQAADLVAEVLPGCAREKLLFRSIPAARIRELCRDGSLAALGFDVMHTPTGYFFSRESLIDLMRQAAFIMARNCADAMGWSGEQREQEWSRWCHEAADMEAVDA